MSATVSLTVTVPWTYVVDDACTACGACLLTCPEHAFVPSVPLVVREDRCTDCGECVEICPADAITRVAAPLPAPLSASLSADHGVVARSARSAGVPQLHDRHGMGRCGGERGVVA